LIRTEETNKKPHKGPAEDQSGEWEQGENRMLNLRIFHSAILISSLHFSEVVFSTVSIAYM